MNLVQYSRPWGCLLSSMAMVLNISTKELIEKIGHDGSEIIFPELPEPAKRRGFHIQEFVPLILKSGFAMTPIEALPCSTPDGLNDYPIIFPDPGERLTNLMDGSIGILTGSMRQWRHAVAWDGKMIYDSRGSVYSFAVCTLLVDVFYRFDQIKSR